VRLKALGRKSHRRLMIDSVSGGWIESAWHFRTAGRGLGFEEHGCHVHQRMVSGLICSTGAAWGERPGTKVQEGENVLAEMV
jgi:hypothetical protein